MATNLKYAVALKNTRMNDIATALGNGALLSIYTGSQPANPDTALGGNTLLAQLTCGSPFAGSSSGGVLTANAITNATAGNTGTAAWFRIYDSGGTVGHVDGTCGTSSADLVLNSLSITSGQTVSVSSLTITSAE